MSFSFENHDLSKIKEQLESSNRFQLVFFAASCAVGLMLGVDLIQNITFRVTDSNIIVQGIGWLSCFACLLRFVKNFRYKRIIEDTPTSTIRSIALGYTEINGVCKAVTGEALLTPFSREPCVLCIFSMMSMKINIPENMKEISVDSTGCDSCEIGGEDGIVLEDGTSTAKVLESFSEKIEEIEFSDIGKESGYLFSRFFIQDNTGICLFSPREGEYHMNHEKTFLIKPTQPLIINCSSYPSKVSPAMRKYILKPNVTYKIAERYIPLNHDIYAIGVATSVPTKKLFHESVIQEMGLQTEIIMMTDETKSSRTPFILSAIKEKYIAGAKNFETLVMFFGFIFLLGKLARPYVL